MHSTEKVREAQEFGKFAENVACDEYVRRGYVVLERNWNLGKIEIDIILQKDDILVLVEVKARSGKDEDALTAVDRNKKRRMIRAADAYVRRIKGNVDYRFDIVTCIGNLNNYILEIYEDAFLAADLL